MVISGEGVVSITPVNERGHTGYTEIILSDNDGCINLHDEIQGECLEAWASLVPAAAVNGFCTDYVSFTNTSTSVFVLGPTVINLYWK